MAVVESRILPSDVTSIEPLQQKACSWTPWRELTTAGPARFAIERNQITITTFPEWPGDRDELLCIFVVGEFKCVSARRRIKLPEAIAATQFETAYWPATFAYADFLWSKRERKCGKCCARNRCYLFIVAINQFEIASLAVENHQGVVRTFPHILNASRWRFRLTILEVEDLERFSFESTKEALTIKRNTHLLNFFQIRPPPRLGSAVSLVKRNSMNVIGANSADLSIATNCKSIAAEVERRIKRRDPGPRANVPDLHVPLELCDCDDRSVE
jgi:hypothetical protein